MRKFTLAMIALAIIALAVGSTIYLQNRNKIKIENKVKNKTEKKCDPNNPCDSSCFLYKTFSELKRVYYRYQCHDKKNHCAQKRMLEVANFEQCKSIMHHYLTAVGEYRKDLLMRMLATSKTFEQWRYIALISRDGSPFQKEAAKRMATEAMFFKQ